MSKSKSEAASAALELMRTGYVVFDFGADDVELEVSVIDFGANAYLLGYKACAAAIVEAMREMAWSHDGQGNKILMLSDLIEYVEGSDSND